MRRDLILGTAGHIDHGKTSLIQALTGVDTDRLPEEKARGITIDIGFAQLLLADFRLGVVDVPGHERFIRNMLAGVTGIDVALLVVAADDSVMPQTREHLEILQLLGVSRGVIAMTKADLVDDTSREVVALEIADLVRGTFLETAPLVTTSVQSGLGIQALKDALRSICESLSLTETALPFRMPIDRAFVIQGHGTIVTGSVISGSLKVGDEVEWHKGDGTSERVRIRSLNNHGELVTELHRGQRGAVNLAGVAHEAVRRGQELASPGYLSPSRIISVRLRASTETHRPLKHRMPVRFHSGTAEIMARLSILDRDQIEPGQTALAQLFLDEPVTAVWGQRFILRDSSAERTLGGGFILQPDARKLRRRHLESLERLEKLAAENLRDRVETAIWFAGFNAINIDDLSRLAGISASDAPPILAELQKVGRLDQLPSLVHSDRVQALGDQILERLQTLHTEQPLLTSHDRQQLTAHFQFVGNEALLRNLMDRLIKTKLLVGDSRRIARADFKPKLSVNQRKLKDRIVAEHLAAGFNPPEPKQLTNLVGGNSKTLAEILEVAVAENLLVKVSEDIHLHAETAATLEKLIREKLRTDQGLTVAEIRDLLGTTRKYAVPICEYLDRAGITRRVGDQRVLA